MTVLSLGIIGLARPAGLMGDFSTQLCAAVTDLPPTVDGILLLAPLPEATAQLLAIRQTPALAPLPVWLSAAAHPLADGCWTPATNLAAALAEYRLRLQALQQRADADELVAFLHYLWCRPEQRITPERDWQSPLMYRYPLLEAFTGAEKPALLLLKRLRASQLIAADALIARVPSCSHCQSAHIIFQETCVACASIDIAASQAVHCFVCGHVGLEQNFRHTGELICPNCSTNLRHIGSDYDRPIENMACRACGELFVEANTQALCAACGHTASPDQLGSQDMSVWMLSDEGRQVCRHGHQQQAGNLLDTLTLVRPEYFQHTLLWLMNYGRRYADSPFSLLLVDIQNLQPVIRARGMGQALAQLDAFIEHLSELVRSTDFMMRSNETRLWLAMPRTSTDGLRAFSGKLNAWISERLGEGSEPLQDRLQVKVLAYCSEQSEKFTDVDTLFAHLAAQLTP